MYVAILDFIAQRKSPLNHVNRKYLLPPFFYPFRCTSFMKHLYTSLISILFNITRPSFLLRFFHFFFFFAIFRFLIREKDHVGNQKLFCFFFLFYFRKKNQVGKRFDFWSDFFSYVSEKNVVYFRKKSKEKISKACKFNRYHFMYVYICFK